jgi:agmatinase
MVGSRAVVPGAEPKGVVVEEGVEPTWHEGAARLPEETWPDIRVVPRSFYGAPVCDNVQQLDAEVAFLGVPFDLAGKMVGARYAPNAIRETNTSSLGALMGAGGAPPGFYDIDGDRQALAGVTMADCGDVLIIPADIERNLWRITRAVRSILERGPLLVTVGGDHSITAPVVRGFDSLSTLDVVLFDAHHDYADHVQGVRWGNGMPIRRVSEFPWVGTITTFGIRTASDRAPLDAARARGNEIVTADRFRALGANRAMELVPQAEALYVTIDIDVLDPSICPGTASPEMGGLTYLEMRDALRALVGRGRVVGIDLVEVSPPRDPSGITAKAGAQLLIDFLTAIFDERAASTDSESVPIAVRA